MNIVEDYLRRILVNIQQDALARDNAPRLTLVRADSDENGVSGLLEIAVPTGAGTVVPLRLEAFSGLRHPDQVDDLLARSLSTVLADHKHWPK